MSTAQDCSRPWRLWPATKQNDLYTFRRYLNMWIYFPSWINSILLPGFSRFDIKYQILRRGVYRSVQYHLSPLSYVCEKRTIYWQHFVSGTYIIRGLHFNVSPEYHFRFWAKRIVWLRFPSPPPSSTRKLGPI